MHQDKYVFSQLVSFLDRSKFNRIVAKYDGDKYVKYFTCWNQLLALMFGQLSNRESLRDFIIALEAHQEKTYHLVLGKNVTKSNLSKANQNRDYRIFESFAYHMVEQTQKNEISYKIGAYYIIDRGYNCFKNLFKIEILESYFVVRAKSNLQFKAINGKPVYPGIYSPIQLANPLFIKAPRIILLTYERFVFGIKSKNVSLRSLPILVDLSLLQIAELHKKQVAD